MMEVRSPPLQSARRTDQLFSLETSGPSPPITTGLSLGVYGNDSNNPTSISPDQNTEYGTQSVTSMRTPLPIASVGGYGSTPPVGASVEYSSPSIPPELVAVPDKDFMSLSLPGIMSGNQAVYISPSADLPPPVSTMTGIGMVTQGASVEPHPQSDTAPRNSYQTLHKDVESENTFSMPVAATGPAESGQTARDVDPQLNMATQLASIEASAPDLNIGYNDGQTQAVSDDRSGLDITQLSLAGESQPLLGGETQPVNSQECFDDMVVLQNDRLTASTILLENGDPHTSYEPVEIAGLPPLNIASFPASDMQGSMEGITEITYSVEVIPDTKDLGKHEEVSAMGKNAGNAADEEPFQKVLMEGQRQAGKEEGLDTSDPSARLSHEDLTEKVQDGQEKKDESMMSENPGSGNPGSGNPGSGNPVSRNPVSGRRGVVSEQDIQAIMSRKVLKKFGKRNYKGVVVDFDSENQWFKVVYEDGDEEDLELSEVKVILLAGDESSDAATGKRKRSIASEDASNAEPRKQRKRKSHGGRISKGTPKKKGSNAQTKRKTPKVKSPSRSKPQTETTALVAHSGAARGGKRKRTSDADTKRTDRKVKKGVKTRPQKVKTARKSSPKKGGRKATQNDSAKRKGTRRRSLSKLPAEQNKDRRKTTDKKKDKSPGKRPGKRHKKIDASKDQDSLVGKMVEKDFDGILYSGTVIKFDTRTEYFKVKYEDGDQEDLELEELMAVLVE